MEPGTAENGADQKILVPVKPVPGREEIVDRGAKRSEVAIVIPWATIGKVILACGLGYMAARLWQLGELLLLALLIAIAFRPLYRWTQKREWPHWVSILLCGVILFGSTALLVGMLVPTVSKESSAIAEKLPQLRERFMERLPKTGPIRESVEQILSSPALSNPEPMLKRLVSWGGLALEAMAGFFVVLVVALYFVADGERIFEWLIAFLPENHRRKMELAGEEITSVVAHYMVGQIITSVLCAAYAFTVLKLLHVPNAALLAVLAAVFDLLPMIGFFLFTIPAMLMAMTVSPTAALLVGLLYGAYHLLENYLIVPKVYGNRLRLSTLTVLISCLAAGLVAGVAGVIIILPVVASYPIIERIWLRPYLERDTVRKHDELEAKEGS
jgi:predicted PurR-regulated permease PerM